jgi:hypothetical protein
MRRSLRPQADLFKTPPLNELSRLLRTAALELLKKLLMEVVSPAEPVNDGMGDQEKDDDQNHV